MRSDVGRILIQSFGSRGDIEPLALLGGALRRRGHDVVYATLPAYRERVLREGLAFAPVRPHLDPDDPEILRRSTHPLWGFRHLLRDRTLPHSADTLADTLPLAHEADLMLFGSLALLGPLLRHRTGTPWLRAVLQPSLLLGASDPPRLVDHPLADALRRPALAAPSRALLLAWSRRWAAPLLALERRHGYVRRGHPIFGADGSVGTLALYSERFAPLEPGRSHGVVATGFPVGPPEPIPPRVEAFVRAGPPPLVVTLGSAARVRGAPLFAATVRAARANGLRALLLSGSAPEASALSDPAGGVLAVASAPYDTLLPLAAAVVHHGGVGVTAAALRAGAPSLIVPIFQDQPDNAARAVRLGVAASLPLRRALRGDLDAALTALLADEALRSRVGALARELRREDGLGVAADAVERALRGAPFERRDPTLP